MARCRLILSLGFLAFFTTLVGGDGEKPATGPQTEKRFPPLKLRPGFKATLFACDPFIEYPSVIAAGPKANSLFVAIDYMTGLGEEIIRRDEIRLIEDTDGDGYADTSTVFAKGFNSIQGLAYHDGSVYVMHAPYLTVLRDTKGAGMADERRDLLIGLGLTPEKNKTRLHCANGVVVGHDGWLYLAMGDNGTDVKRPEGDRLVFNGGGILRCRPDGRDLHGFSTGLRNIYDVALDAELNVFVRDNENDGGDYKIRVCHSFFGADHGYPYLYYERPDEALPPIADLGLGSSAGGVCYLERRFPPEYRGNLFFCEWGRSVVRYQPRPSGSGFGPVREIEFAVAAENDPYGFKPTDVVVQRDGALMVADWADGQRPKRGRGRIYRITSTTPAKASETRSTGLDSESYYERVDAQLDLEKQGAAGLNTVRRLLEEGKIGPRGRLHAAWLLARGPRAIDDLLKVASEDRDSAVRRQAIRAIADITDPVLVAHRLDAGAGDADIAQRLATLAEGADAPLQREVVIALGRLRWPGAPNWLAKHVTKPDASLAHAAMQAMRRAGNWPDVLNLLDRPSDDVMRGIALRVVANQYEPTLVDGLVERLTEEKDANRRRAYADMLTRVHRKPGPWVYWGYRPGPRPANSEDWERTVVIAAALNRTLADPDRGVRLAVLRRMLREKAPADGEALTRWLVKERGEEAVGVIMDGLRDVPAAKTSAALTAVVREKAYGTVNRLRALALLSGDPLGKDERAIIELARELEHGPVLAEVLRQMGRDAKSGKPTALAAMAQVLPVYAASNVPEVRAAAVETLGELGAKEGRDPALKLLGDSVPAVRRAAAAAAGKLALKPAADPLLKLAKDPDAGVRRASFDALRLLREPRAAPLAMAALDDRETQLAGLECLAEVGGPEQAEAVAAVVGVTRRAPPTDVLAGAIRLLAGWTNRAEFATGKRNELECAIAEVHAASGTLVRWQGLAFSGPVASKGAAGVEEKAARSPAERAALLDVGFVLANPPEWRVNVGSPKGATDAAVWHGYSHVIVSEATPVEFTLTGAGATEVRLNQKSLYRRVEPTTDRNAVARFPAELAKGPNSLLVIVPTKGAAIEFALTFRRKSAKAAHEKLISAALAQAGNVERGRKVFLDAEKSLCLKCHKVGDQGEKVGPELTGIGARFGRVYLVESILEPGRTVVPGFANLGVELKDGRVFTGVKAAETDATMTLVDKDVKKHELKKAEIVEQRPLAVSAMPDGLETRLTGQEFVDLIAYLVSLKERGP